MDRNIITRPSGGDDVVLGAGHRQLLAFSNTHHFSWTKIASAHNFPVYV